MRVFYLSLIIVIVDQLTKLKVKGIKIPFLNLNIEGMTLGSSKEVFGNFFKITFIENPGMAFGIELGGKLTLSIFTLLATFLIIYFIFKNRNESFYLRLSLAFILGGAVGNLIDRLFYGVMYGYAPLFYGKVVDFFHFNIPEFNLFGKSFYSWPIFNVADISVTAGFLMILLGYNKIFKKQSAAIDTDSTQLNSDISVENGNLNQDTQKEEIHTEIKQTELKENGELSS
ncbi:MAG: signal peptidase II [Ignavibacteriae bacterium]|nr:signal peptidase II [Ignavibacteriota bacterium]